MCVLPLARQNCAAGQLAQVVRWGRAPKLELGCLGALGQAGVEAAKTAAGVHAEDHDIVSNDQIGEGGIV
jgi:hypothetical protein